MGAPRIQFSAYDGLLQFRNLGIAGLVVVGILLLALLLPERVQILHDRVHIDLLVVLLDDIVKVLRQWHIVGSIDIAR